jgi:eukaryotic-like serine/threonine-protein kinase
MNLAKAEEIFHQLLELETADARSAFLDSVCRGNLPLRAHVAQLLAAHDAPIGFLDTLPAHAETIFETQTEEIVGSRIGRYKLLERVGEGGCGVVYVAEQTEPVRRRVALKVIKLGMDTKSVVARFEAERQALAMMDHPNIAKVLDAGTTEAGRPYFVMELVRGVRITEYCDQNNVATMDRLDLFVKVCHAIQHAHQKGIIHRDIKPSNILVTLHDSVPVPKVIDFGIAKATEGRLTDATVYTQLHQFIGTPAYMSPEQAEMSGLDIDTRSDIYSLGVLLYELLTGAPPFDPNELMKQGLDEMRRTLREKEPARPSTRLGTLQANDLTATAKRRSVEVSKLLTQIKGDLDWIVMKCLEKDRTRRYETANALAADLNRHLSNEPVLARPPSSAYRLQKAWRRNKLPYSAAIAVGIALIAGAIVSYLQANRARNAEALANIRLLEVQKERDATEQARQNAEQISQYLQQIFQSPDPAKDGRTITVAEMLDRAAKRIASDLAQQPERRARLQSTLAGTYASLGLTKPAIDLREKSRAYWLAQVGPLGQEAMFETRKLAHDYVVAGDGRTALRLTDDLLARSSEVYGLQHTNTVVVLSDHADALDLLGRHQESLELRKKVFAEYVRTFGADHENTLQAMNALGISYHYCGLAEKSLALQEKLVALTRRTKGAEHPATVAYSANLAVDYLAFERYREAIELVEPLLRIAKRIYGPEHAQTLFIIQTVANVYDRAGRRGEALELREDLLEMTRKVEGAEHPIMVFRTRSLGESYYAAGRTNEAFTLLEKALALGLKIQGPKHREVAAAADLLGFAYSRARRYQDAAKAGEQAVESARHVYGSESTNNVPVLKRLISHYRNAGQSEKLPGLLDDVIRIWQKSGIEHPDIFSAIRDKAGLKANRADWKEAREELLRVLEFKELPDDAHFALLCLAALDVYLGELSDYDTHRKLMLSRFGSTDSAAIADRISKACLLRAWEGEELNRAATLAQRGKTLTNESSNLAHWQFLASALGHYRSGDWSRATEQAERSLSLSKDISAPESTSAASFILAMARQKRAQPEEARAALQRGLEIIGQKLPSLEKHAEFGSWHDVLIAHILGREARQVIP